MALETVTNVETFLGNGVNTSWPLPFKFWEHEEIQVTHVDLAGVETPLELGVDYTVTGGDNRAGTVEYPIVGPPLPGDGLEGSSEKLIARRVLEATTDTRLKNQGEFFAEQVETRFDKTYAILQQHAEELGRAVKQAISAGEGDVTFPPYAAGQVLGWDLVQKALRNYTLVELGTLEVTTWSRAWNLLTSDNAGRLQLDAMRWNAGSIPIATDDASTGHNVYDVRIVDSGVEAGAWYVCLDNTVDAAVWVKWETLAPLGTVKAFPLNMTFAQGQAVDLATGRFGPPLTTAHAIVLPEDLAGMVGTLNFGSHTVTAEFDVFAYRVEWGGSAVKVCRCTYVAGQSSLTFSEVHPDIDAGDVTFQAGSVFYLVDSYGTFVNLVTAQAGNLTIPARLA